MTDLFSFDFGAPAPLAMPPRGGQGEAQSGASPRQEPPAIAVSAEVAGREVAGGMP